MKIQTEMITSHKKNLDIDWTWQELDDKEDAEELAKVRNNAFLNNYLIQDIEAQKQACREIIE